MKLKPADTSLGYADFLQTRAKWSGESGFRATPPDFLYDFQKYLFEWSCKMGRGAIFADCGMGKTPMQLAWADAVVKQENRPVLLVTPLAVGHQTLLEAAKFGIEAKRSRDGAIGPEKCIWITNYEQMHKFDSTKFCGVVCDESSAIKNFKSARKETVVEFMRLIRYRLLCTATAAPNDYFELGTSSEALGLMGFRDMITKFFKQETSKDFRGWGRSKFRFKGHAEDPFWSWVCSWARSIQSPSDLGFDDSRFQLPALQQREIIVDTTKKREGMLFSLPALSLDEQRAERRNSLIERCTMATEISGKVDGPCVLWCELNSEGDKLTQMIDGAVQVKGSMPDEKREEILIAFTNGEINRLVTKPKIGAWGLNWQHCSNMVMFPSHSFEQYYQAVRRCYRFGQTKPVNVTLIVNEGESGVLKSLDRKAAQCRNMFASVVRHMKDSMHLVTLDYFSDTERLPKWL